MHSVPNFLVCTCVCVHVLQGAGIARLPIRKVSETQDSACCLWPHLLTFNSSKNFLCFTASCCESFQANPGDPVSQGVSTQAMAATSALETGIPSCPQSFPASGSFPMSWLFPSSGQSIGVLALALVLPVNIQDWFPSGWTRLISLLSKGLSRVFSNSAVQKHQFHAPCWKETRSETATTSVIMREVVSLCLTSAFLNTWINSTLRAYFLVSCYLSA